MVIAHGLLSNCIAFGTLLFSDCHTGVNYSIIVVMAPCGRGRRRLVKQPTTQEIVNIYDIPCFIALDPITGRKLVYYNRALRLGHCDSC